MKIEKRIFAVAICFMCIATMTDAQTRIVNFRQSQTRMAEPLISVYSKPLIADLKVNETRIDETFDFPNSEIEALGGDIPNLRARAMFLANKKYNCDMLVSASFDIASKSDGTGYVVNVMGYPATYINWRSSTPNDDEWIRIAKINQAQNNEQTQAIRQTSSR